MFREQSRTGDPFVIVFWDNLKAEEEGEPHAIMTINGIGTFRTFHVSGEFGGASLEILGGIIPGEFDVINDGRRDSLIFDERSVKHSADLVLHVKPKVLGGTQETNLTVGMVVRK